MSLKKLTNITPAELKSKGVVSLADKPNAAASYGVGGLSPTALKLWFDQLSKLLADKINGHHAHRHDRAVFLNDLRRKVTIG